MALGARERSLVWDVVRRHLRLAGGGVAVGLVLAVWGSRLIASFLFGVAPGDPLTFTSVTVGVLILALVATYVPARRIAALDPATVLRPE
jgi:ABC-type antimicrobial peptide transport system permease subunit